MNPSLFDAIDAERREQWEKGKRLFPSTAQTRHEAHEAIKPVAQTLKEKVYQFILEHPGVTDQQIAQGLNMPENTARPRRLELANAGRIKIVGATMTRKGRKACGWAVVPADDQGF